MTGRQKILKTIYPALMWFSKKDAGNKILSPSGPVNQGQSFFTLKSTLGNGKPYDLASLKGKKILLVNTASDCGYTAQYDGLQKLQDQYPSTLMVIGFPSNDFKEQEQKDDEEIARFCKINYGVRFPLMQKSIVKKQAGQHEIFKWLSDAKLNGWNDRAPVWNFSKYLIDEQGQLLRYFPPGISPLDKAITDLL